MTSPAPVVPLDKERLLAELADREVACDLTVVTSTGSTNADVAAAARSGAGQWTVVVAAEQRQGRGRLQRHWASPAGSLSLSVLLRPSPPLACWGWLPLLTGVAAVAALRTVAGDVTTDGVGLKWPNDVMVVTPATGEPPRGAPTERKLAGILVEQISAPGPAAVVGIGVNVTTDAAELAVPTATSVQLATGLTLARELVAAQLLAELVTRCRRWEACDGDADGSGLRAEYVASCRTLGRLVRLDLPGGDCRGVASGIDPSGRLLVVDDDGTTTAYGSGEVVHLR